MNINFVILLQKNNNKNNQNKKKVKKEYPGKAPIDKERLERHSRGEGLNRKGIKHPLHAAKLKRKEKKLNYAQEEAARAEILLTEEKG